MPGTGRESTLPWKWIGVAAAFAALVIAGRTLPADRWLTESTDWVAGRGATGILVYVLAYAVAAVFLVPGAIFTLGGGFIFGVFRGTVAVSLGSTLGAALAFLIARYVARKSVLRLAAKNAKFAAIDGAIGRQGWKIVLLLRLSPLIPFNVSNYLYGLTGVRFWPYVLASWAGMLPVTVLYVYLGAVGRAGLLAAVGRGMHGSILRTVFFAAGLLASIAVTWYVSHVAKKALRKADIDQRR